MSAVSIVDFVVCFQDHIEIIITLVGPGPPGWGFGVGLTTLPCKKKIPEKPPRNSAGFCGGGQGPSWAVEPRKERSLVECSALWNEFKVNNTLDIQESDEHCLHL
jgi:hypothetical protein